MAEDKVIVSLPAPGGKKPPVAAKSAYLRGLPAVQCAFSCLLPTSLLPRARLAGMPSAGWRSGIPWEAGSFSVKHCARWKKKTPRNIDFSEGFVHLEYLKAHHPATAGAMTEETVVVLW